jgi:predicted transcriptional regulator
MNSTPAGRIRREGYTFHGLRASSVESLREAGCDDAGVASITGMSQAMIRRYSRFIDQRRLAKAAVLRLERTGRKLLLENTSNLEKRILLNYLPIWWGIV